MCSFYSLMYHTYFWPGLRCGSNYMTPDDLADEIIDEIDIAGMSGEEEGEVV